MCKLVKVALARRHFSFQPHQFALQLHDHFPKQFDQPFALSFIADVPFILVEPFMSRFVFYSTHGGGIVVRI